MHMYTHTHGVSERDKQNIGRERERKREKIPSIGGHVNQGTWRWRHDRGGAGSDTGTLIWIRMGSGVNFRV